MASSWPPLVANLDVVASPGADRQRRRGTVTWLPSGSARVKVYAGIDQLTGQKLWLRETVKARETQRETKVEAEKTITRLLNQIDERRSPRTEVTVNELLDRWLEVIDVDRKTRVGYVGKIVNLEYALTTNRDIGVAMGVLMTRYHLARDQALDLLRITSQRNNRKLHDIAVEVADTGTLHNMPT